MNPYTWICLLESENPGSHRSELKVRDLDDKNGGKIASNQKKGVMVSATFSTCCKWALPDRREPHQNLVPLFGLPSGIAEAVLSQGGREQLAMESTRQVPMGPIPSPQLRFNNNYKYLCIYCDL